VAVSEQVSVHSTCSKDGDDKIDTSILLIVILKSYEAIFGPTLKSNHLKMKVAPFLDMDVVIIELMARNRLIFLWTANEHQTIYSNTRSPSEP